jgi:hypothetical protein
MAKTCSSKLMLNIFASSVVNCHANFWAIDTLVLKIFHKKHNGEAGMKNTLKTIVDYLLIDVIGFYP